MPKTIEDRFWAKVDRGDGCWRWTAGCDSSGYGSLKTGQTKVSAHRLSWQLHHGPVPPGQNVLHRCDNPRCVRPSHLFLGTQADNIADMLAKGRGCFDRMSPAERRACAAKGLGGLTPEERSALAFKRERELTQSQRTSRSEKMRAAWARYSPEERSARAARATATRLARPTAEIEASMSRRRETFRKKRGAA